MVWSSDANELFRLTVEMCPVGRALDLGCGEGRNAIWLAEQGWQVTAVDFSAVAIDKAEQIAARRQVKIDWQVADVCEVKWPSVSFDLVSVIYMHTSLQERERWLPQALGALKAGGQFLYIGHDPSNIEAGVGGPQDPDLLPDVEELSRYLSEDFEVLQAKVVQRPVDKDAGHGAASGIALDNIVQAVRR